MTISASGPPTVRRHSFLRRNPQHDPAAFSHHYETVHGPLAAAQAGFRKFSLRYVQNHVDHNACNAPPPFDGVTSTTQVPRDDYATGFFNEPDYENVKSDEMYLFDISRTVSVIGRRVAGGVAGGGAGAVSGGSAKLMVLCGQADNATGLLARMTALFGAQSVTIDSLDRAGATALGFRGVAFDHDFVAEVWFATPADRSAAMARIWAERGGALVLPVRELVVFG